MSINTDNLSADCLPCILIDNRRTRRLRWNAGEIKRHPEVETLPVARDNHSVEP